MVLDSLASAEVVQLEQLPDLDFAILVMGVGAALDPLDRFRKRLTLQDPVARYQFLGLREVGPSITLRLSPENLTRAPLELGCNPLPSSITPAFTISSLNFAMAESNSSEGILPASKSLVALTITMKRIVVCPLLFGAGSILALLRRRTKGPKIDRGVNFFQSCRPSHVSRMNRTFR